LFPSSRSAEISYGFYLWHYFIITELNQHGFEGSQAMLATFGLTLAASIVSYRLVERPALRLHAKLVDDESTLRR
jgi:peptidoglycan/LPS O-acetylase OafA/YrhL